MQLFRKTQSNLWDGAIDVVSSAKAADVCNRISGQELSLGEASLYEEDVLAAKKRELDAWPQFKVYSPMEPGGCDEEVEPVGSDQECSWFIAPWNPLGPDLEGGGWR